MVWSYDDPGANPKDAVRLLVGDTDSSDQFLSNEEIEYLLGEFSNPYSAAAAAAETLSARFAREVASSGDGLSYSGDQLQQHFADLAERLRKLAGRRHRGAGPYVGGISWREREQADADMDKIPTHFRSHMHDHPGTRDAVRGSGNASDPLRADS